MIRSNKKNQGQTEQFLSLFQTQLGWFGLLGYSQTVTGLKIGYSSPEELVELFQEELGESELEIADWYPELRKRLENYSSGTPDDFHDVTIQFSHETAFQKKVRKQTRSIPYGKQYSYLEIAEKAGSPRAARAVGNVMRTNPVPLIMPCHRVISSDGGLGGFSAPTGTQLKEKLLNLESE